MTNWQVTTSNSAVVTTGLGVGAIPHFESGLRKVKPNDNTLHQGYKFYVKITAARVHLENGDTEVWFGVYDLRVGCYWNSLSFTDSSSFITNVDKYVGDEVSNIYTMYNPTPSRAWCRLLFNEFSTENAEPWIGPAKFSTDVSQFQPFTVFNLVSTSIPEVISFRIKSTFTNTQLHYSPRS